MDTRPSLNLIWIARLARLASFPGLVLLVALALVGIGIGQCIFQAPDQLVAIQSAIAGGQ